MKVTFPKRKGRKGVRGKARVAKLPSSEIRSHFLRGVSRLWEMARDEKYEQFLPGGR